MTLATCLWPGPVSRIRVKGDHHHHTRIAFVEFLESRHAKEALACSGALLGEVLCWTYTT